MLKTFAFLVLIVGGNLLHSVTSQERVSILDFGATGDDTTDDTSAINSALSYAKANGLPAYAPTGNYYYSSPILVDSVHLSGDGEGSLLNSINPQGSAVTLLGTNPGLESVKIVSLYGPSTNRTAAWAASGVVIGLSKEKETTNFIVRNVHVFTPANVGIIMYNAGFGRVETSTVEGSKADCIHIANGSHDIVVEGNKVKNCGDDMYAAVSNMGVPMPNSTQNFPQVRNVLFKDNEGTDGLARGLACDGSKDITFLRNRITNSSYAGILVASHKAYNTYPPYNIVARDNILTNVGQEGGHSGLMIVATFGISRAVLFENNTVTNTTHDGFKMEGATFNTSVISNRFENIGAYPIRCITACFDFYVMGNTLDGIPIIPKVTGSSLME